MSSIKADPGEVPDGTVSTLTRIGPSGATPERFHPDDGTMGHHYDLKLPLDSWSGRFWSA